MLRASTYFAETDGPAHTVPGLRIIAIGPLLLLIRPFNKGAFLNLTHMTIGVITALAELSTCGLFLL
jgi:hypothetical protein